MCNILLSADKKQIGVTYLEPSQQEIYRIKKELETLPKGSITHKKIDGKVRIYLQWRDENGRTLSRYLKASEEQEYAGKIEKRRELEQRLRDLGVPSGRVSTARKSAFRTSILYGEELKYAVSQYSKLRERDALEPLMTFLKNDFSSGICVLSGLRSTGKTTLIFHAIGRLGPGGCAYIKLRPGDTSDDLFADLELLSSQGFRYVFADDFTLAESCFDSASLLSDYYGAKGMKIVVSLSDVLGFSLALSGELHDRCTVIDTTFLSFSEWSRLLGNPSLDAYAERGGMLRTADSGMPGTGENWVSDYIGSVLLPGIQKELSGSSAAQKYGSLKELSDRGELEHALTGTVEKMCMVFLADVAQKTFRRRTGNLDARDEKYAENYWRQFAEKFTELAENRGRELEDSGVTERAGLQLSRCLATLGVIRKSEVRYDNGGSSEYLILTQPHLRFSIASETVRTLMKDAAFMPPDVSERKEICDAFLSAVRRRIIEDALWLETTLAAPGGREVVKLEYTLANESEYVVYDADNCSYTAYVARHSEEVLTGRETRNLRDERRIRTLFKMFGKTEGRYVIYRGKSIVLDGIVYVGAEEYLREKLKA